MKFFTTLLCSMVALASAAAISFEQEAAIAKREVEEAVAESGLDIVTEELEDGTQRVDFKVDGVSDGYVIISPDGDVRGFEVDGEEIDLDALLEGDETALTKRSWLRLLIKLGPIIKRFGSRVLSWLRCVGMYSQILNCGDKLLRCAQMGQAPWDCLSGIACIGNSARKCS